MSTKTPLTDKCDAEWTRWLQDTWAGKKSLETDTAPITPIEHSRRMERERAELFNYVDKCAEGGDPEAIGLICVLARSRKLT